MNFKFLLVLTMVLCVFCVLPVNAQSNIINPSNNQVYNIGNANAVTIIFSYDSGYQGILGYKINNGNVIDLQHGLYNNPYSETFQLDSNTNTISFDYYMVKQEQRVYHVVFTVNYVYTESNNDNDNDQNFYNINIDLQENPLFELGNVTYLDQTFTVGSSSNRVVKDYTTYLSRNCEIIDLKRNYVKIKLNPNYNYGEIFLSGNALLESEESEFTTKATFNYTYMPVSDVTAYIQTFDYQTGNMVSGVNMSVYEVIDHNTYAELGQLVYSSINTESQTILQLKNNTEYFVKNDLTGYFAVKNENYPYFNNEVGYWWDPSLNNPLILYYSRLDPTAQYNANFIVQDVNNIGISGVSVTIDNSITKISNSIGGLSFENVTAGTHTFTFTKNGYQTAQRTINIQLQYATFTQTLFKDNQIIQPTVQPTAYPTIQPTVQPTYTPIDQPSNLAESVKYGLAKMFGVNSLNSINLIFALLIILFPAVVAGVITNQALGFIAGGLIGFVFALGIGLIPLWVFFSMIMLSVIYLVMTHTESGF